MKNTLLTQSSPRGNESFSQQVAQSLVNDLKAHHPDAKVLFRDLAANTSPHVGLPFITGLYAPPEHRTPEQAKAIALSDALIDELSAADTIVIAVPMHNLTLPSTLKRSMVCGRAKEPFMGSTVLPRRWFTKHRSRETAR